MTHRIIVVVRIQCGPETILVRNLEGTRTIWQLPGGRVESTQDILPQVRCRIQREVGITIPVEQLLFLRRLPRKVRNIEQMVYVYTAHLDESFLTQIPRRSGDHQVKRVPSAELASHLEQADLLLFPAA